MRHKRLEILPVFWFCVLLVVSPAAGWSGAQMQRLDRVVASISGIAITQSDVRQEYRLETFLAKGHLPSVQPEDSILKDIQSRLIDQKLLAAESEGYHFDSDLIRRSADERMKTLRNKFNSDRSFQAALHELGIDEKQLMDDLEKQEKILLMIDEQLRPAATVNARDVEDYYQKTFLPAARANQGSPPPLAQVRSKIREILVQKKINQLLDEWLSELRKEHQVEILEN